MARRRDLAEDLLQETFLRLARAAPRLAADTRLCAWLFTVARNLYLSHCRASELFRGDVAGLEVQLPSPHVATPFEDLAATETQRQLERAVGSLPSAYREILLLVSVE